MPITRGITNPFSVVDWTREVSYIPNIWGTINSLGIFQTEPVAEHAVLFQEVTKDFGILVDRVRGERSNVNKDYTRKLHAFAIPHFPDQDQILPKDLQGKSGYGDADGLNQPDTVEAVRARKMERMKNTFSATLEYARAVLLTTGNVYAPNGTVSQNWFTEFGVTQTVVDFVLGTTTTDVMGKFESVIAAIQDNAGALTFSGIVGLCSPEFFAKFIKHPVISDAYKYYMNGVQPLRDRSAPGGSVTAYHREFEYMGVRLIEMRDKYAVAGVTTQLIPANDAVFIPTGTDFFKTYFGPAERFDLVNTMGQELYWFEKQIDDTAIHIDAESNFANACMKPALIIRGTSSN